MVSHASSPKRGEQTSASALESADVDLSGSGPEALTADDTDLAWKLYEAASRGREEALGHVRLKHSQLPRMGSLKSADLRGHGHERRRGTRGSQVRDLLPVRRRPTAKDQLRPRTGSSTGWARLALNELEALHPSLTWYTTAQLKFGAASTSATARTAAAPRPTGNIPACISTKTAMPRMGTESPTRRQWFPRGGRWQPCLGRRARYVPDRPANQGDSRSPTDNQARHMSCIYAARRMCARSLPSWLSPAHQGPRTRPLLGTHLDHRFRSMRLLLTGSARCTPIPAAASSAATYRHPVQPSSANSASCPANRASQARRCSRSAGATCPCVTCPV